MVVTVDGTCTLSCDVGLINGVLNRDLDADGFVTCVVVDVV